jgi:predicted  nucleic acid-binding Zn-ribbon protein
MEEILRNILAEMRDMRQDMSDMRQDIKRVEGKIDDFRESQEVTNKLLTGDAAGIKNQLRDLSKDSREFRREVREWQLSTNRRIDNLEEKLVDMRDALQ